MTTDPAPSLLGPPIHRDRRWVALGGGLAALLAVVLIALFVWPGQHRAPKPSLAPPAARVIPRTAVPPVEPLNLAPVTPAEAIAFNAKVPFVAGAPGPAARPFRFAGDAGAKARALDCLAIAELYEAGDDDAGERAIAQVVINRTRHPAFPKTICAVVFEGAGAATGCQFTFTCDGALTRYRFADAAWARARAIAQGALAGTVYAPVGHATHYHTNWVVPYWSASLDKIAVVGTHLFFRWTGWWGTPAAFDRSVNPAEPAMAAIAPFSPAHRDALAQLASAGDAAAPVTDPGAPFAVTPLVDDANVFLAAIDSGFPADRLPELAGFNCKARSYCKFLVWADRGSTPHALPLSTDEMAAMSFSYLRDRALGFEKPLWNCGVYPRANPAQCMKRRSGFPQIVNERALRPETSFPKPELLVERPRLIPRGESADPPPPTR